MLAPLENVMIFCILHQIKKEIKEEVIYAYFLFKNLKCNCMPVANSKERAMMND